MHGLLAGGVALVLGAVLATGAGAVEPATIPTANAGVAAPRCIVGQLCTFAAPIFACNFDYAERIAQAGPDKGAEIGNSLVSEKRCETVPAGRPFLTDATKSNQVLHLTENGTYVGYMPVGVFALPPTAAPAEPEEPVPITVTTRVGEFVLKLGLSPVARAVGLAGQGTGKAIGAFRVGMAERRTFCADFAGSGGPQAMRDCFTEFGDREVRARADCGSRVVTVLDRTYRLHPRPADLPVDGYNSPDRRWLWRDVANDEWLDGTTASGESTVDTAFDALCPGGRPGVERGVVLRDPTARFPLAVQGTWTESPETCSRVRRAQRAEPVEGALTIRDRTVQGYEYREELTQLHRLDGQGVIADVSWDGEGDSGQASVAYRLLDGTLVVTNGTNTQRLSRCR